MLIQKLALKTTVLSLLALASSAVAWAVPSLTAMPSSTEITEDENISVEIKTSIDELSGSVGKPSYDAPDFDEVNVYRGMSGIESSMATEVVNGQEVMKMSVRRTESVTVVLHPRKTGKLRIRGIKNTVNGKVITAPDIEVDVAPEGTLAQGKAQPYSPRGRNAMPNPGVQPRSNAQNFFLRTEPSKRKAYKGEQIILTYAMYTRVQVLGSQVERYPTVPGFLKEDIDIPLLTMRLNYQPVIVNGQEYNRAVLAQYAIYPVKEGTQTIDPLTGKFSYRPSGRMNLDLDDDDDPFGMFNQFRRAMQTMTTSAASDRVSIEVLPLPAAGQPKNFSGLVGDFDITAVVDKYSLKMGEPLNVKVKVSGKGHAGSLERLNVEWPRDFELYEDKATTNFLKTGYSERLFDFMLIPKTKGKFTIGPIELSMFNPDTGSYQVRKTEPIEVDVLEGSLGSMYIAKGKPDVPAQSKEDIRYWMPAESGEVSGKEKNGVAHAVARGAVMASMVLAALSFWSLRAGASERSRQERSRLGKSLLDRARALGEASDPLAQLLEAETLLAHVLQFQYGIQIGSLTRADLKVALSEKGVEESVLKSVESVFERCDSLRFAPAEGDAARKNAQQILSETRQVAEQILTVKH